MRRKGFPAVFLIAMALLAASWPLPSSGRDDAPELRREKVRLLEMKRREEKAAADLTEALRKEKMTKKRVGELQTKLKKQRNLIAGIDRKLDALNGKLGRTEKEVEALAHAHGRAQDVLRKASVAAFAAHRLEETGIPIETGGERHRYFMRVYLGADLDDVSRLARERERKEGELSGIERQVRSSERKMTREKRVGQTLLSRREEERKALSAIGREKEKKSKELKALRARIARMERLVSRVERLVRERERKAEEGAGHGTAARGRPEVRQRFASLRGGLSPPLAGKVITPFGKQHDATFDVTIENRGVEIDAPSGATVKAVGRGEVAFEGSVSGFGNVLILQHGSGLFSVYGKLSSFLVKQGETVGRGDVVGRLPESPSGKSVLYLELRAGGTAIDPTSVIPLNR